MHRPSTTASLTSLLVCLGALAGCVAGTAEAPDDGASEVTRNAISTNAVLLPRGATWRYHDRGVDLGTGWRATAYNDSNWRAGAAELGYGDGDERTRVSYGGTSSRKSITTYFRTKFTVNDPGAISALALRLKRDDGAVVYLNGVEAARSNMPTGPIAHGTRAAGDAGNESTFHEFGVSPALLARGTNVVAVEVHQASRDSSDISMDLEVAAMLGTTTAQPVVTVLVPAAGATVSGNAVTLSSDGGVGSVAGFTPSKVSFQVDGVNVGTGAPTLLGYVLNWDSTRVANGTHKLTVTATNGTLTATSAAVSFAVSNLTAPPPPACGDAMCDAAETCSSCPGDCGGCPPPPPTSSVQPFGLGQSGGPTGTWKIDFQDEFSGTSLDTTKWTTGWFGTGISQPVQQQETACYDPKNVVVTGGTLNLIAEKKSITCGGKTRPYTSGAVQSRDKYQFTYGYIEARIYLPGSGSTVYNWPAFWTTDYPYTGEIDVMEGLSGEACAHFHPGGENLGCGGGPGWHVYAAEWSSSGVTIYYDGKKIGSTSSRRSASDAIIIGNQMSPEGEHGGPVMAPATMQLDYVRIWKRQ